MFLESMKVLFLIHYYLMIVHNRQKNYHHCYHSHYSLRTF